MKRCCVCHHEANHDDATCPRCGEASWGSVLEKLAAPPAEPVVSEAVPAEVIIGDEVLEPVNESVLPEDADAAPEAPARRRGRK